MILQDIKKWTNLFVALLSLIVNNETNAQTFTNNDITIIPDFACTEINLQVTGVGQVMNNTYGIENVCIDISHENLSDLVVSIISPAGIEILLTKNNGGTSAAYANTCFDGQSSINISDGTSPFTGNFLPEESLGLLNSGIENIDGIWKLKVCDEAFFDVGNINSFSITFSDSPAIVPQAQNDECFDAIAIETNTDYTCTLVTSGSLSQATFSGEIGNCYLEETLFDDDVWFSFIATSPFQEIEISNIVGSTDDLIFQVLIGSCGSLTSILCHDNPDEGFTLHGLNIGNNYYLRIASKLAGGIHNTSFSLCVKEGILPPPINDECTGAALIVYSEEECISTSGTVAGATASLEIESCDNDGGFSNDVWFYFIAQSTEHLLSVYDIQGSTLDLDFQISKGPCNALVQNLCYYAPQQGEVILISANNLEIGAVYFLRVATFVQSPQNTTFKICFINQSDPPLNDECSNAILLTQEMYNCNISSASLTGATASPIIKECGEEISYQISDKFNDDVWYYFVAEAVTHQIDAFNVEGTSKDLIFQVFEGNCNAESSFFCYDEPPDEVVLNNLTIGETYYIRVASYDESLQNITFDIQIQSCYRIVCSDANEGRNSLREMVLCADPGETIYFSSVLSGEHIWLESPTLVIDKNLILENNNLEPVFLSNSDLTNTSVLMDISSYLSLHGIQFKGKSPESMIIQVSTNGTLRIY